MDGEFPQILSCDLAALSAPSRARAGLRFIWNVAAGTVVLEINGGASAKAFIAAELGVLGGPK